MAKKVTYNDVAKLAKVSPASVSRVLSGLQNVDSAIRERVMGAATTLGVDSSNRRSDSHPTLAFVLGNRNVLHSFQARILAGAESHAVAHGWEIFFLTLRYSSLTPSRDLQLPQILGKRTSAKGLILAGVNSGNLLEALRHRRMPFSVLGNNLMGTAQRDVDIVFSDDYRGSEDVTQHLIQQGHRHIWYIGDTRLPWFKRCGVGYARAMKQANLEPQVCEIHSDGDDLGYLGAKSILSRREPVTAVFAGSDHVAAGVYKALREAGLSVPEDVSVVGFSDSGATLLHPALTSVREFPEELGRHLVDFTLKRIENPSAPFQSLTIPTQLVVRDSTRKI